MHVIKHNVETLYRIALLYLTPQKFAQRLVGLFVVLNCEVQGPFVTVSSYDQSVLSLLKSLLDHKNERRLSNTPDSYSGGTGFKSRPRWPAILTEVFVVFLSPSRRMLGQYLKIRPRPLPTRSFPNHHQSHYHRRYVMQLLKSVVK
jgi:hypothetical protein